MSLIATLARIVVLVVMLAAGGFVASAQAHEGHGGPHAAMHHPPGHVGPVARAVAATAPFIAARSTHSGCRGGMACCTSCTLGAACCAPAVTGEIAEIARPGDRGRRIALTEPPVPSQREPERPAEPPRPRGA